MSTLAKTTKQKLANAHSLILAGVEQMKQGCVIVCECLDEDRDATIAFMRARGVSDEFLDLIENVGRGRIHPRLMFMPGPGPERLQRAPMKEQERILNAGVEVARLVGDEFKKEVKPLAELTRVEAEVAIDSSGNVSVEKQVEKLKQRLINSTFKLPPYKLDGDTLLARENCRIPYAELERLYRQATTNHAQRVRSLESDIKRRQIA